MKEQKFNHGRKRNPYLSKHPDLGDFTIGLVTRKGTYVWNGDGWSLPFLFKKTRDPKEFASQEEAEQEMKTKVLPYILKWQPGYWEDYVVGHEHPTGYNLTERKTMKITSKQLDQIIKKVLKEQLEEKSVKEDEDFKTVQVMKELILRLRTLADRLSAPGDVQMNPNTTKDIHKYLDDIDNWLWGYEQFVDEDTFWNRLDSPYRPPEK